MSRASEDIKQMKTQKRGRAGRAARLVALVVALLGLLVLATAVIQTQAHGKGLLLAAKKEKKGEGADPFVVIETSKGALKAQIFKNEAPVTAGNFLDLVGRHFYDGLSFHRYEPGFVIQGGDPNGTGSGGFVDPATHRTRTIPLEVNPRFRHDAAGYLAMARSSDPNSASSQFYITLGPAPWLDGKYAIFGKVVDGLNVVRELRAGDRMTKVYEAEKAK